MSEHSRRWDAVRSALQVLLREDLAFLDRQLIERIDAEEMRGDDRLKHEMHEEFAWLVSSRLSGVEVVHEMQARAVAERTDAFDRAAVCEADLAVLP
jgi:hypothetical protein